jgi:mannose-6-phosphate isomerase
MHRCQTAQSERRGFSATARTVRASFANGPLKGRSIGQVMKQSQEPLMGKLAQRFQRFPLLLKFLDAHEMLSVQVHPGYSHANIPPADGIAKTEAWVVLEAGEKGRLDAGLKAGTTTDLLRQSVKNRTLSDHLVSITPKPGEGVFIPAGTVHSLGDDVVGFEVQQNSDVAFHLYDWAMWMPFTVGAEGEPRVLVCVEAPGQLKQGAGTYPVRKGEVYGFCRQ